MLDAFAQEMDHTQSRMDGVLRKMAKISHMTSGESPGVGEWGGVLGRTAARPVFCSFSKHLLDNYYVHNNAKSLGYSGE